MKTKVLAGLIVLFFVAPQISAQSKSSSLIFNTATTSMLNSAITLEDKLWDSEDKFLTYPEEQPTANRTGRMLIRESSWYAVGLLLRDAEGDRQRAADIIHAVIQQQYTDKSTRKFGTYRRSPEDGMQPQVNLTWRGYDPNWREFIGSTFALILIEFPEKISPTLAKEMHASIDLAIEGEIADGRLLPSYSNIALMYGFLLDYAAQYDRREDWKQLSATWNMKVYKLFKQHNSFFEYNSPTYYGVDLYGLALWRRYGSSKLMKSMASSMEASLWNDIAIFYHPDLHNLCGPYDRSYGMDMENYVSLTGIWMKMILNSADPLIPVITPASDHLPDIYFTPLLALVGTKVPESALNTMRGVPHEHAIKRKIDAKRTATAWLSHNVMYGGEVTRLSKDAGVGTQFHPATIQWRTPTGSIGWAMVSRSPAIDAYADRRGMLIRSSGTVVWRIHAEGLLDTNLGKDLWQLPGLNVIINCDAARVHVEHSGDDYEIHYEDMTRLQLKVKAKPDSVSLLTKER